MKKKYGTKKASETLLLSSIGAGIAAGLLTGGITKAVGDKQYREELKELDKKQKKEEDLLKKYRKDPNNEKLKDEIWLNRFGYTYKRQQEMDKEYDE